MFRRLIVLALTVSTFTSVYASNVEVQKAKDFYLNLFVPNQSQSVVEIENEEIVESLFSGEDTKEILTDLKNFSKEISNLDLAAIVKKQKVTKDEMPAYADLMSRRLVALGLLIDKRAATVSIGSGRGKLYGAIVGAAAGFVFVKMAFGKEAWTNYGGSQNDLGSLFILGMSTVTGVGGGMVYNHYHDKPENEAFKKLLGDLKVHAKLSLEKLKKSQTNQFVNELE